MDVSTLIRSPTQIQSRHPSRRIYIPLGLLKYLYPSMNQSHLLRRPSLAPRTSFVRSWKLLLRPTMNGTHGPTENLRLISLGSSLRIRNNFRFTGLVASAGVIAKAMRWPITGKLVNEVRAHAKESLPAMSTLVPSSSVPKPLLKGSLASFYSVVNAMEDSAIVSAQSNPHFTDGLVESITLIWFFCQTSPLKSISFITGLSQFRSSATSILGSQFAFSSPVLLPAFRGHRRSFGSETAPAPRYTAGLAVPVFSLPLGRSQRDGSALLPAQDVPARMIGFSATGSEAISYDGPSTLLPALARLWGTRHRTLVPSCRASRVWHQHVHATLLMCPNTRLRSPVIHTRTLGPLVTCCCRNVEPVCSRSLLGFHVAVPPFFGATTLSSFPAFTPAADTGQAPFSRHIFSNILAYRWRAGPGSTPQQHSFSSCPS
ncbi:hypothetical protein C8R45DRAFT_1216465 [Mycena sanguinolenta]|nr:hypothetical protein C8R45DRAFT_1216465 [Mycena sanguinolenta]